MLLCPPPPQDKNLTLFRGLIDGKPAAFNVTVAVVLSSIL